MNNDCQCIILPLLLQVHPGEYWQRFPTTRLGYQGSTKPSNTTMLPFETLPINDWDDYGSDFKGTPSSRG
eukprot:m.289584 g.289584  ORF g.289584 m.289584 type:complete len:70 (-) comp16373_c0_seq81:375-584(-)